LLPKQTARDPFRSEGELVPRSTISAVVVRSQGEQRARRNSPLGDPPPVVIGSRSFSDGQRDWQLQAERPDIRISQYISQSAAVAGDAALPHEQMKRPCLSSG